MNLTGLNPFSTPKKIKIFAERNTGSIYLEWLLKHNLKIDLIDFYTLGWRHRLAPAATEVSDATFQDIIFVFLVKNPYSWLQSMHLRPYQHDELKKLSFSQFIRFSYGDYVTPIHLWNIKNKSYMDFSQYVHQHTIIKYEDLLHDAKAVLEQFAIQFGIAKTFSWFEDNDHYMTNHHGTLQRKFHKHHYTNELWKEAFLKEDIAFINRLLDEDLMKELGYNFI